MYYYSKTKVSPKRSILHEFAFTKVLPREVNIILADVLIRKAEENNNTYVIIIPMEEIWGTMGESGLWQGCCINITTIPLICGMGR